MQKLNAIFAWLKKWGPNMKTRNIIRCKIKSSKTWKTTDGRWHIDWSDGNNEWTTGSGVGFATEKEAVDWLTTPIKASRAISKMNPTAEHTPTPWTFGVYEASEDFKAISQHSCICDPQTKALIATCGKANDLQSQTDAAFIVRAVNAHEKDQEIKRELVQMLNVFIDCIDGDIMATQFFDSTFVKKAKQAIAKAEGK